MIYNSDSKMYLTVPREPKKAKPEPGYSFVGGYVDELRGIVTLLKRKINF